MTRYKYIYIYQPRARYSERTRETENPRREKKRKGERARGMPSGLPEENFVGGFAGDRG